MRGRALPLQALLLVAACSAPAPELRFGSPEEAERAHAALRRAGVAAEPGERGRPSLRLVDAAPAAVTGWLTNVGLWPPAPPSPTRLVLTPGEAEARGRREAAAALEDALRREAGTWNAVATLGPVGTWVTVYAAPDAAPDLSARAASIARATFGDAVQVEVRPVPAPAPTTAARPGESGPGAERPLIAVLAALCATLSALHLHRVRADRRARAALGAP